MALHSVLGTVFCIRWQMLGYGNVKLKSLYFDLDTHHPQLSAIQCRRPNEWGLSDIKLTRMYASCSNVGILSARDDVSSWACPDACSDPPHVKYLPFATHNFRPVPPP
jgi:hypothetical protein